MISDNNGIFSIGILNQLTQMFSIPVFYNFSSELYGRYVRTDTYKPSRTPWTEDSIIIFHTGDDIFHAVCPTSALSYFKP